MSLKGNKNAQKHGGAAALEHVKDGEPFTGLAYNEEQEVKAQLAINGTDDLILTNATRLQVATNLYWSAVCKAAEDRDLETLDRYIARFGWLASKTLLAWSQVKIKEKPVNITDLLKGGDDEQD